MTLPVVSSAADVTGNEGREVQVRGTYGVQDLGRHALKVQTPDGRWEKVHKVAFVRLDDGSFVSLEARPAAELDSLLDRRVAAAGKLTVPAEPSGEPAMASPIPVPTLVEISAVEPLD